jgi:hypothetical protein
MNIRAATQPLHIRLRRIDITDMMTISMELILLIDTGTSRIIIQRITGTGRMIRGMTTVGVIHGTGSCMIRGMVPGRHHTILVGAVITRSIIPGPEVVVMGCIPTLRIQLREGVLLVRAAVEQMMPGHSTTAGVVYEPDLSRRLIFHPQPVPTVPERAEPRYEKNRQVNPVLFNRHATHRYGDHRVVRGRAEAVVLPAELKAATAALKPDNLHRLRHRRHMTGEHEAVVVAAEVIEAAAVDEVAAEIAAEAGAAGRILTLIMGDRCSRFF